MENTQILATEKQINFIKKLDASFNDFENLTLKEASKMIGRLLKAQKQGTAAAGSAAGSAAAAQKINIVNGIKFYYNGIKYSDSKLQKMSYYINSNYEIIINEEMDYHTCRKENRDALINALKVNIKNDTDIYTDYFEDDSYIIKPENENYIPVLNAIASLCKQLKEKKSYNSRVWDKIEQLSKKFSESCDYLKVINDLIEHDKQEEKRINRNINQRTVEEAKKESIQSSGRCLIESDSKYIYLSAHKARIFDFTSSHGTPVLDINIIVFNKNYDRINQFVFENTFKNINSYFTEAEEKKIIEQLQRL